MSAQPEQGPSKRPKLLACARFRHRKQKCTEERPCENCTQSGAECIPARSVASKPPLEPDYVQRLEERIAQLESLIPQESLDHINGVQHPEPQSINTPVAEIQSSLQPSNGCQNVPRAIESPIQHERTNPTTSIPFSYTPLDNLSPGLFGTLSGILSHSLPTLQRHTSPDGLELDLETERFLIQTYFDMAHSQYPFLLKHQFLEWVESWRNNKDALPLSMQWKGFFVYMVYSIAFLMTKARINGAIKSQLLYKLATSTYLPYLVASPDPIIRAQGFLLLTIYALHMPSQENIIALSSWTMRFCIMSQLHLAETEPRSTTCDALIQIQHRRKIFWCAYSIDRAVCSSYDFPCSIPDHQITVPIYENIDDDQLLKVRSSSHPTLRLVGLKTPTNLSSSLHVLTSRQLESEIQEMVLSKDFVNHSDQSFTWRTKMLEKVKEWNRQSVTSSEPSQKGYVSLGWLKMIYYYKIMMLYRPTRIIAQGVAGDWSVQACCQALLLFRKFQMAREIAQPWLGLLTQFQIGVTLLYCFYATPTCRWKASYKSPDVSDAIRACSSTLAILAERWAEAECVRDIFEILAREVPLGETWERPITMSEEGKTGIDENWEKMSKIVIHRPTLRMIREMATETFINDNDITTADLLSNTTILTPELETTPVDEIDLQWGVDPTYPSSLEMETRFDPSSDLGSFSGQIYFPL